MNNEEKEKLERYLRLRDAELNDNMEEIIEEEYQKFINEADDEEEDKDDSTGEE